MTLKLTISESKEVLTRIGAEWDQPYKKDNEIRKVFLPLLPVEWCAICMREPFSDEILRLSQYRGDAEEVMPSLQKYIRDRWFYWGGWADTSEIVMIGKFMRDFDKNQGPFSDLLSKDGLEDLISKTKTLSKTSAWDKIAIVYHAVKDHYNPRTGYHWMDARQTEIDTAFGVIDDFAHPLSVRSLFASDDVRRMHTENANLIIYLYRFLPALKYLNEQARTIAPDKVEGWGIYQDDSICENRAGYCIYLSQEEAQEMIDHWVKFNPGDEDRFSIKKVRVSIEDGIEILS